MRKREYFMRGESGMPPTHPGAILRGDVLPALGLSVSESARQLGVSRQTLHRVLAGTMAVSPEMALRLAKAVGCSPESWLAMQHNYDLWQARQSTDLSQVTPIDFAA